MSESATEDVQTRQETEPELVDGVPYIPSEVFLRHADESRAEWRELLDRLAE